MKLTTKKRILPASTTVLFSLLVLLLTAQHHNVTTVDSLESQGLITLQMIPLKLVSNLNDGVKLLLTICLLAVIYQYHLRHKRLTKQVTDSRNESMQSQVIAKRAVQEQETFLANINHDIRTPLNAILGFSELLTQKQSVVDQNTYLNEIRLSGNKLLASMNELLDLSSLESGQLTLDVEPIAFATVIQAISRDMIAQASHKNVQYQVRVDPAVPAVLLADPVRLIQILSNVCSTALKLTQEGGYVRLTVHREEADQPHPTQLLFTINGSGAAIPEDKLRYVFDRYSQLSDKAMFRSGGLGLGLNIAHSLVMLMNGTIAVQSQPDQGTTFTVLVPVEVPAPQLPVPAIPASVAPLSLFPTHLKVLIVEDNKLNQKVLVGFLQKRHIKSTIANNGLEAVSILTNEVFDLIFMDIQMPEMDGYTATRTIRQMMIRTPIVAMTAYKMAGERGRCIAAGMNDYLSKPIHMQQLNDTLNHFTPAPLKTGAEQADTTEVRTAGSTVDERYLDELMDGDNELLAELVSLFAQDLSAYRHELFKAVAQSDQILFNQTAHKFRSSLNTLAMLDTAKKLKQLEVDGLSDQSITTRLTDLFDEINLGLTFLTERVNQVHSRL